MYPENEEDFGKSISSAAHVDNVNSDPVVIVNGLTKVTLYITPQKLTLMTLYIRTGVSRAGGCAGFWVPRIS